MNSHQVKNIVILGTGGNSIDILDTLNEINLISPKYNCLGFLDDNPDNLGKSYHGHSVLGTLSEAKQMKNAFFVNGIGSPTNFWKKEAIIAKTGIPLAKFETLIHPTASVSKMSQIGRGVVIFQNVSITSNAIIKNHVIILPNSVISHDVEVGDFSCITGGVCISGGTKIGKSCYLGTNSSVIGTIEIGDNCLIGMGSNVLKAVKSNAVVMGEPAIFKRSLI